MNNLLLVAYLSVRGRLSDDRGDVPGWVLITVMTAGLVSVLWFAAGDKLGSLLDSALSTVAPSSGQ